MNGVVTSQSKTGKKHYLSRVASVMDRIFSFNNEKTSEKVKVSAVAVKQENRAVKANPLLQQKMADYFRNNGRLGFFLSLMTIQDHYFDFLGKGKKVPVRSVTIKHPEQWKVTVEQDDLVDDPYYSVLKYLSHPCPNLCTFCLHDNDIPGTRSKGDCFATDNEIDLRLLHYNPSSGTKKGSALPSRMTYNYYEIISHPRFFEIARAVRKKSNTPFFFVTSGIMFTKNIVNNLKKLKPLTLGISLNCVSQEYRKELMQDPSPGRIPEIIRMISEAEIPYFASVAFDFSLPFDELLKAVSLVDKYKGAFIRVNLLAFSRHHARFDPDFDHSGFFHRLMEYAARIRNQFKTPILFQPVYLGDRSLDMVNRSLILGAIKGSPAAAADIKSNDILVKVEKSSVENNPFLARKILSFYSGFDNSKVKVTLRRDGRLFEQEIENNCAAYEYPFRQMTDAFVYPFGLIINDGISVDTGKEIKKCIEASSGLRVLILVSQLMYPLITKLLAEKIEGKKIYFKVPKHTYWGGNIMVGDLYVAEDYLQAIREWEQEARCTPDHIIVPASPFGRWGLDLSGQLVHKVLKGYNITFIQNNPINAVG